MLSPAAASPTKNGSKASEILKGAGAAAGSLGLKGAAAAGAGAGAQAAGTVAASGYGVGAAPAGGIFAGASAGVIAGVTAFMALWVWKLISFFGAGPALPADVQARLEAAAAAGTLRTSISKSSMQAR